MGSWEPRIPDVHFQPWRGARYGPQSSFGLPVLIVGESHHWNPPEAAGTESTLECIQSLIQGTWRHRFFTNVEKCFTGNSPLGGREQFCSSVAFFNYIQSALLGPGASPTEAMWQAAAPPFVSVLCHLKPHCVLFVCKRLFERVRAHYDVALPLRYGHDEREAIQLQVPGAEPALGSYILHPSYRGWRKQIPWVLALLERAGGYIPPNKGLQPTAYSVRSFLASASSGG